MCLTCAIPVRGRTLGSECLSTALGPDAVVPEVHEPDPGAAAHTVALGGFALAALATVLPWSRFGTGSGPFGAWEAKPTWAMVAAVAALTGLILALGRRLGPGGRPAWDVAAIAAGAAIALAAVLAVLRPPFATSPWLGPWVALAAGATAALASIEALREVRRGEPAHV
jgi:hypothetical protein